MLTQNANLDVVCTTIYDIIIYTCIFIKYFGRYSSNLNLAVCVEDVVQGVQVAGINDVVVVQISQVEEGLGVLPVLVGDGLPQRHKLRLGHMTVAFKH